MLHLLIEKARRNLRAFSVCDLYIVMGQWYISFRYAFDKVEWIKKDHPSSYGAPSGICCSGYASSYVFLFSDYVALCSSRRRYREPYANPGPTAYHIFVVYCVICRIRPTNSKFGVSSLCPSRSCIENKKSV